MSAVSKSIFLIISFIIISCSSEDSGSDRGDKIDENPIAEPIDVLNLVSWHKIADTPVNEFNAHIVYQDKLYSLSERDTYVFDFILAEWTLLASDTANILSNFSSGLKINFIRNGKWSMFTQRGLYEFDFELNSWSVIKQFPLANGLFSISGFYAEQDEAIYFLDKSNGNKTIYKFDLTTNELEEYSTYINTGNRGDCYNGSLTLDNSNYYVTPSSGTGRSNEIIISKFSEDFTSLISVNNLVTENDLDSSVALQFDDYIIFGLGGIPTVDGADGTVTYAKSTLKFYAYDTLSTVFTEMSTPFYESCWGADVVVYNNEYYLINGRTIKDEKTEFRNKIEKITFDFTTK
ncbi:hypothetical protein [Cellulophaga baltica]|uniref:Uncharacterized protein n=1 Tax=Cellulophaga baltica 18 TaxID=1348584 RepID=A0AAU8RC83_9FLAO|nr:hypothetical protein [Cellulophaga baltica]AIZ40957.1 hypothetical protein M666_04940 [Cellulophaga baltica 18]WFO15039.1 hypothetical protein M601_014275 [Cellulophaga baltica 4]